MKQRQGRLTTPEPRPGPRDERGVLAGRILDAARELFATEGYAGTSIRAVARAAAVDPALVHHYYGTKDGLLTACLQLPPEMRERVRAAWASPRAELGAALVRATLDNWADPGTATLLRTVLLTAAHHERTHDLLRALVEHQLMGPAELDGSGDDRGGAARGGTDGRTRAGLVASQLIGLGLTRFVWRIEPLASMSDEAVVAAVGPTLQRYVDGDLAGARRRGR